MTLPRLLLLTPGLDFIQPYIEAKLSDVYEITTAPGGIVNHTLAVARADEAGRLDQKVINTLLITSDTVIGTGMNGLGRTLAEGIAGGRVYHIKGNEAQVSAIHATALAQAARMAVTAGGGTFTIADSPVSFDTLIEALATRIDGRRIYTIGPKWSRWLMPADLRTIITTDSVINADFGEHFPEFKSTSACEYLTTHDYSHDTI